MECLIPGLILVALMIYASTRIKKVSANAFKAETIETEAFTFEKTEEFLNKVDPSPGLELEGYSREYGSGDAANIRQATYQVDRLRVTFDTAFASLTASKNKIGQLSEMIGERKYGLVEMSRKENDVEFVETYKLAGGDDGTIQLCFTVQADAGDDVSRRVETMLAAFVVK